MRLRTTTTLLTLSLVVALAGAGCGDGTEVVDASGGANPTGAPSTTAVPATSVPEGVDATALEELGAARLRWDATGIDGYRYVYTRACECDLPVRGPNEVVVRDGAVATVTAQGGLEPLDLEAPTIAELFDRIEASIRDGEQVAVSYDEATGHPVSVALDVEAMAVDGGYSIEITSLTPDAGGDEPGDDQGANALAALEAAEARWAERGPVSYELSYQLLCFCPEIVQAVTVRDGEVVDVATEADGPIQPEPLTVEDLFAELRRGITGGAHQVQATYDEELGYPVEHWIDEDPMVADEEHGVSVRSLVALG